LNVVNLDHDREKAADHILGKQSLPRSNQEPWVGPRWEVSDR